MTRLRVLDVIRIHDEDIKPPGPKFIVCVEPVLGLFLRINSDGWRDGSIAIGHAGHATFLRHDSFIECGSPLDPDSFIIERALLDGGIRGRVDQSLAQPICNAVMSNSALARRDKLAICRALGCGV